MAPTTKKEPTAIERREDDAAKELGIPLGLVEIAGPEGNEAWDSILGEILAAGSVEKALGLGAVEGLNAYDGQTLVFHSFRFQPSDFDTGPGAWPYVVAKASDSNGELKTVTTGARQVIAILALAQKNGELPFKAKIERTDFETESGERRAVTKLVPPE